MAILAIIIKVQHFAYVKKLVVEKYAKIRQIWQICHSKNIYANHLQNMPNLKNLA